MAIPLDKRYLIDPTFESPEQRRERAAKVVLPDSSDMNAVRALAGITEPFRVNRETFDCLHNRLFRGELPFSAEQAFLLGLETELIPQHGDDEGYKDAYTPKLMRDIGVGEVVCPECRGTKLRDVPHKGPVTGVRTLSPRYCKCAIFQRFYTRMENPKNVGVDYHQVRLRELKAFEANFQTFVRKSGAFESLVETVNAHPENSYLLAGPSGKGKTTLLAALYSAALWGWSVESFVKGSRTEAVWIVNCNRLAAETLAWEFKDVGRGENEGEPVMPPTIREELIQKAINEGFKPCIFLEEFDKFKLNSDYQRNFFLRIIDLVHSVGGQIVATSNLSEYELRQQLKDQYGGSIIRRITGARGNRGMGYNDAEERVPIAPPVKEGGFYIDFFQGTITQNLEWEPGGGKKVAPNRSNAQTLDEFDAIAGSEQSIAQAMTRQDKTEMVSTQVDVALAVGIAKDKKPIASL